jgi:hypothetical protein
VVEKNLGTVGKVELLDVAEVLTLLLVVELDVVGGLLVGLLLERRCRSSSWSISEPPMKRPPCGGLFAPSLSQLNDTAKGL